MTIEREFKISIKDLVIGLGFFAGLISQYYAIEKRADVSDLKQDKVNALTELKLQTLSLQIENIQLDLKEVRSEPRK